MIEASSVIEAGGEPIAVYRSKGKGPSIVLEAGAGAPAVSWANIWRLLGPKADLIAYDRPGFGGSTTTRPDPGRTASRLFAVLNALDLKQPAILVGHSLGGLYARVFAAQFPRCVRGLVLIDPTPPELAIGAGARSSVAVAMAFISALRVCGLDVLEKQARELASDLCDDDRQALLASYRSAAHFRAMRREFLSQANIARQAEAARLDPRLPLLVLSAGSPMAPSQARIVEVAQKSHARLCAGFEFGRHQSIETATHVSIVIDPEAAQRVTREILEFASVRDPGD